MGTKEKAATERTDAVKINRDFEMMLISAERYAFGRMTYIVDITVDYIMLLLKRLSNWCIDIMLEDLAEEYRRAERLNDYRHFGMECDKVSWDKLYNALREEADSRNN